MPSSILSALPSIHVTLVGIGGSVIVAYALYAHQKLEELKRDLTAIKERLEFLCKPEFSSINNPHEFLENGKFDWENKGKKIFLEATEVTHNPGSLDPMLLDRFITVLHLLLVSYPIGTEFEMYTIREEKDVKPRNKTSPTLKRTNDMVRVFDYLLWTWNYRNKNIEDLVNHTATILVCKETEKQKSEYEKNMEKMIGAPEHLKEKGWFDNHLPRIDSVEKNTMQRAREIEWYFGRIQLALASTEPLSSAINRYEATNNSMPVWPNVRVALICCAMILVLGVLFPIIILDVQETYSSKWYKFLEYGILAITFFPYFLATFWAFRKVNAACRATAL